MRLKVMNGPSSWLYRVCWRYDLRLVWLSSLTSRQTVSWGYHRLVLYLNYKHVHHHLRMLCLNDMAVLSPIVHAMFELHGCVIKPPCMLISIVVLIWYARFIIINAFHFEWYTRIVATFCMNLLPPPCIYTCNDTPVMQLSLYHTLSSLSTRL